jgi:hypothetical protein
MKYEVAINHLIGFSSKISASKPQTHLIFLIFIFYCTHNKSNYLHEEQRISVVYKYEMWIYILFYIYTKQFTIARERNMQFERWRQLPLGFIMLTAWLRFQRRKYNNSRNYTYWSIHYFLLPHSTLFLSFISLYLLRLSFWVQFVNSMPRSNFKGVSFIKRSFSVRSVELLNLPALP